VNLAVGTGAQDADGGQISRGEQRQRRADLVCAVWPKQKLDFVHIDELGVDVVFVRGIGLIIVVDELHRASKQATFGVYVIAPYFQSNEELLAVRRVCTGQAKTKPDLHRFCRRRGVRRRQQQNNEQHHGRPYSHHHAAFLLRCMSSQRPLSV
jgi:hypothetical protein